ncbi:MAG: HPr family phosphocarrier protein [Synergistaceae bacterium]|jgi:phosphocarrier protein|nr:HPr family phosphocarrier protein [Synergistaceae bacterium]
MKQFTYTIRDKDGVHARPAGVLVKAMQGFESKVTFQAGEKSCDGKKLFALMAMGIRQGSDLIVTAEGVDEEAAALAAQTILEQSL